MSLVTIVAAAVVLIGLAVAASPSGTDPNSEITRWYRGLWIPNTGSSCCNESDCCRHLPTRITAAGYEVLADGNWLAVPPDTILASTERAMRSS